MELVKALKTIKEKAVELISYSDELSRNTQDLESEIQELQERISEKALCGDCEKQIHNEQLDSHEIEMSPKGWFRKDVYLWNTTNYSRPYQVEIRTIDIKPFNSEQEKESREYFESIKKQSVEKSK